MKRRVKIFNLLLIVLTTTQFSVMPTAAYQTSSPELKAAGALENMTPEERVGQLFLVSFQGTDVSADTEIYNLITKYHIGGVILKAENDNFTGPEDAVLSAWNLAQNLQRNDWEATQTFGTSLTGDNFIPMFIPMFIGIDQNGGGPPDDDLFNELTPIPNQLALGATWNPDLAYQTGEVLGEELSAMGINMLLGPSLDVSDLPVSGQGGDLGINTFGGDPYWVGEFAKSFISGVHDGSNDAILVVGKHFPGYGGSDRPLLEEIPTVRKSLEQLQQIELPPFFAVTGLAEEEGQQADGLLLSHIRYQGFQGNIRATTRPLSFDAQALSAVLNLPEIAGWRDDNGLIISDDLGSESVHRFYELTGSSYIPRLVVRDAFLAGNDILYLGTFTLEDGSVDYASIEQTINFFAQKYREDVAFAQRVDESVFRILVNKYRIYGQFILDNILQTESGLFRLGDSERVAFEVSRQAATLISPDTADLDSVLPTPPGINDQILILTDTYSAQQCSACPVQNSPGVEDFAAILVGLYGPATDELILEGNLLSFSYADLIAMLDGETGGLYLRNELSRVEWVIFLEQDVDNTRENANALLRLLAEEPQLLQGKQSVVFSLHVPYNLDATAISKLTAVYGLYGKQPQFLEVAARLLFKELSVPGASPVSIPGIGYDMIAVTLPNPTQNLTISLSSEGDIALPEEDGVPIHLVLGDNVSLSTSIVLDHNQHPVPDGTPIHFEIITTADGLSTERELVVTTRDGITAVSFGVEAGFVEVQAQVGDTVVVESNILQFDVAGESDLLVVTATAQALEENGEDAANGAESAVQPVVPGRTGLGHWLLSVLLTFFLGTVTYQMIRTSSGWRWGVRGALAVVIGGQLVNVWLSFELPGAASLVGNDLITAMIVGTLFGAGAGWLITYIWQMIAPE